MRRYAIFTSLIVVIICYTSFTQTSGAQTYPQKNCDEEIKATPQTSNNRYYLVLAGRSGTFYDKSGPTFPMLIKVDGKDAQVNAVGIYSEKGKRIFGRVPAESYNEFMKESPSQSDVMLRLEISGAQYERCLKFIQTWERRAREGALLYPDISMDNIVLVKQVTESLNQCGEKIKLYKLDWSIDDRISEDNLASLAPFLYFKELRRLNDSLHVRDERFQIPRRPM